MRVAAAWSWRALVVLALIAVVGFLIVQLRYVVIPFFIAVLISALLVPFSSWLQRHRWPKGLAVTASLVVLIGVIGGLVTLVVFQVRSGIPAVREQAVERWEQFREFISQPPFSVSQGDIDSYVDQAFTFLQDDIAVLFSGALSVGSDVGHVLAGALLALFATIFILIDGRIIWNWFVKLFPNKARPAIVGGGEAGWLTLTTFVKVQIFVAFVDAVGIGLGAWILGLFYGGFPLVVPIAVLVFLGSFIPIVGAVLTGALAVVVALIFLGPIPAIIMLGIVLLVQQVEGHVLQPFIMGSAVEVHPLAVVLAVATGGFVGGIPGALFAVPIVAVINVVVGYMARGEWRTNPHPRVADVTTRLPRPRRR